MKVSFCNQLFLCVAALALGILGDTTAQAQSDGVPVWTNSYSGPGNYFDEARAVAVDGSGNVFVTGYSYDIVSGNNYATIAYSGAGVALWTNSYNGPTNSNDIATALAVDGSGNVFVTGDSWSGTDYDYATIKYSGSGMALWTNRYNGTGNSGDIATALAVDGSGNVFVTGESISSGGNNDYATIKYSGSGVGLWTNRYDGPGNYIDKAIAVALDGSGNVFVTGTSLSSGTAFDPTDRSYDYATIKYSGSGMALWTNRYNGPGNKTDEATAVAVDSVGNVFVTGFSWDSSSAYDYATIKYSGAGVPLWTNRYDAMANSDQVNVKMDQALPWRWTAAATCL